MIIDPTTILITTGIALGSAVGGYLSSVKINSRKDHSAPCPLLDVAMARLNSGDQHFKEIDEKLEILPRLEERIDNMKEIMDDVKAKVFS